MKKKTVSEILSTLLLIGMLVLPPPNQLVLGKTETLLHISPSETKVCIGSTFTVNISLIEIVDLYGYDIRFSYNTNILDVITVGPPHLLPEPRIWIDEPDGIIRLYKILYPPEPSVSGNGTLASITFNTTALGSCLLDLFDTVLVDPYLSPIPHTAIDGSVTILSIHGRWAVIDDGWGDRLKVETASHEIWSILVELYQNRIERWIGGTVERYDNEWGFRFNPETIHVAEYVAEVYQTTIHMISEDLDKWLERGLAFVWSEVVAINPIRVPHDHPTIQEAIYQAVDRGTILVSLGTYCEHVIVSKTISLIGGNPSFTIINGTLDVQANNVEIRRMGIENGQGIRLENVTQCKIIETISRNSEYFGIILLNTSNSQISSNEIYSNFYDGICLDHASNNNAISSNRIQEFSRDGIGIHQSAFNTIEANKISNGDVGLHITSSSNHTVKMNTIIDCATGIWMEHSHNNTLYHNNFVNNTIEASLPNSESNTWDNGCEGNHWSNYTGTDSDGDGIGDTPYVIDENNQDNHPLISPYMVGDINHDGTVDINDLLLVDNAYGNKPEDSKWNCHCDIDGPKKNPDELIDIYDLATVSKNYGKIVEP